MPLLRKNYFDSYFLENKTKTNYKLSEKDNNIIELSLDKEKNNAIELKLRKITPVGVECLLPADEVEKIKDLSECYVFLKDERIYFGLIVYQNKYIDSFVAIGVRFFSQVQDKFLGYERRDSERWICPSDFLPTCIAVNPYKFNQYMFFKIKDISEHGLRLITSIDNQFLSVKNKVELLINLPTISYFNVSVLVRNLSIILLEGKEYYSIGVEFIELNYSQKESLLEYLMRFGDVESKKNQVFRNNFKFKDTLCWNFLKKKYEYTQLLDFKKTVLSEDESYFKNMQSIHSHVLVGSLKNEIVSYVYINLLSIEFLSLEKFYIWNNNEIDRSEVLEVDFHFSSKYKKEDLMVSLFFSLVKYAINSKKNYIVFLGDPINERYYKKIGANSLDKIVSSDFSEDTSELVYCIDIEKCMSGFNLSSESWYLIYYQNKSLWLSANKQSEKFLLLHVIKRLIGSLNRLARYRFFYPRINNHSVNKDQ